MIKRVADALLHRVYHPVTAVLCTGRRGRIVSIRLYDTDFALRHWELPPGTRRIDVICSHPDGRMELSPQEISNCWMIASRAMEAKVFVYIYGEDIGLLRVDSGVFSGYNGENTR
ncbi:MAG: hypothetical protein IKU34_03325 [Clostridia bacterium]|nr:hypothetical protein [Clostridia bacterium]